MTASVRSFRARRVALVALLAIAWGAAQADVFRPAYLEVRETGHETYDILWKVPAQDEQLRLSLHPTLPEGTVVQGDARRAFTGDAIVERWQARRPGGLAGQTIRFEGRAAGATDVIARVEWADGSSQLERLAVGRAAFEVEPPATAGRIAWSYLVLGIGHILGGIDHLLFVLALLLLVRGTGRIVLTITAFTIAHSVTLVAATLGWIRLPGPPVEAIIALSIGFVAAEVVHGLRGRPGLTARAPWSVAFVFGLLHGLGFAGALAEVGLPQKAIAGALLMFNVGVEIGQLLFVAAMLLLLALSRRLLASGPRWIEYTLAYSIGTIAMFWVIERVAAFWTPA